VIELTKLLRPCGVLGQARLALSRERGNAAVQRIDDDRAASDAVDGDDAVAGFEPEAVVAANLAPRGFGDALDE
jgi:hypothetical protein